ncbi:putative phage receptor protein [Bacillus subtilis Miyagi-4]|nr:putative phage receptor protein [Bacillus subtilis Miyagi-4]
MFWWKNESFGMCLYSWRDWRKHGRNDIDCYTFFGSLYSILFLRSMMMKKKWITFGLLVLMVCVILFVLYVQLRNKDSIHVQSSAIHPEEDRIFFIYSNPFIKESVLVSTSTGERFNRRTFKVADVPYIQTKSYASTELVLLAEHEPFYYTLEKDAIKEHPLSDPIAFWYEGKDVSVKAYNVDTTGNEIHINDKKMKKEYSLTLPSLVTMGASDENYIYIIQSMSIYVIDRKTEEMIKTLSLASYRINSQTRKNLSSRARSMN